MSRRYLTQITIRVCLFKSKYIPGVRVERPGISGPHRAYFDFPFFFFFFFFCFSPFSFLYTFTVPSTYALCRQRPSFPLLRRPSARPPFFYHVAFFHAKPNSLASSRTLQDYFLRVGPAGWETANAKPCRMF